MNDEIRSQLNQPKFVMMIGTLAAGKSTWSDGLMARLSATREAWIKLEADEIRGEFARHEGIPRADIYKDPKLVERSDQYVDQCIQKALETGSNIIFDGTNILEGRRAQIISLVNNAPYPYRKVATYMAITAGEAEARYLNRPHKNDPARSTREVLSQGKTPNLFLGKLHDYVKRLTQADETDMLQEGFDMVLTIPTEQYRKERWTELLSGKNTANEVKGK